MDFRKQKSIYQQIADRLMDQLVAGTPAADERMPSVRDVAVAYGVNPNTVMRSFDHLQQAEIIYNRRGVGYFVAPDAKERILQLQRKEFLDEELPAFMQRLSVLGMTLDDLKQYV